MYWMLASASGPPERSNARNVRLTKLPMVRLDRPYPIASSLRGGGDGGAVSSRFVVHGAPRERRASAAPSRVVFGFDFGLVSDQHLASQRLTNETKIVSTSLYARNTGRS